MEITKKCRKCEGEKNISEFSPHPRGRLGVSTRCKKCSSLDQMERYKSNPELLKERAKSYRNQHPEKYKKTAKKYRDLNPSRKLIEGCRYRAKKNNIPCNIEATDIIVPEFCPVFGIRLSYSKNTISNNSPSIDRIIPSLGYVKGNIRVISYKANRIKGHATVEELKQIIKYIENESTF